ncbi:MAG: hypothetical protein ACP5PN_10795 [Steroidobacteraceae bacterium]
MAIIEYQQRTLRCRAAALAHVDPVTAGVGLLKREPSILSAIFWGLNGATRTTGRLNTRHRPATSVLLLACDPVPS